MAFFTVRLLLLTSGDSAFLVLPVPAGAVKRLYIERAKEKEKIRGPMYSSEVRGP